MRWHRIKAVLLHSYYHGIHSKETWIDLVWFTLMQFFIFGFIAQVFSQNSAQFSAELLLGFFFWEVVRIGQYCVTISILWEVWSKSLNTMFVTPLTMAELMVGQAISALIKTLGVMGLLAIAGVFLFHFSLFSLGPMLMIYVALLLLFSFAAGLFVVGLILRYGTDIQSLAWGLIFLFQPFSAVYYSIDVLPPQVRWFAYFSPITYVMESARKQLSFGEVNWMFLLISGSLTALYLIGSMAFLRSMYTWAKFTGSFARLGN
jgi:ABC-2 type transport system permease protein